VAGIVLGYDRSPGAERALETAIEVAKRYEVPLVLVHRIAPPGGVGLELELLGVLQSRLGHVSWESVLSGPGLVRLYDAVCTVWGAAPEAVGPEWITRQGVDAAEPVCHQTLEVFCGLLGAAAGNLAVTAYALGGVYLGGGILPGMVEFVRSSPLRRRFEERGPMTERVRRIPLYLVRDGTPGLVGALACLLDRHIDAA
jgi:glucokinase